MGDRGARASELTYEEHCRILDEIAEAGCLWLLYTGGEIFARKDFLDIYTHAKRKGLIITLFTNGTLITDKIAEYLTEWRPFAIEITLYGRTRDTYERLTGIPGSYDRCMRGIGLLKERGLPLKLKTVGVTINKHEIWDMKSFAEEELGVEFMFDSMINPRIDCSQSPLAVRLRPEEIVELDLSDPRHVADWIDFAARSKDSDPIKHGDELYHCGGGINAFAIDPQGRMSICVLSHFDAYDLRQGSFREGWESFVAKVRHKKITRITKCVACGIKEMCGMCPANGELENGDPESPVDFLCQTAHLRAYTLDIPVRPHGACEYCQGGSGFDRLIGSAAELRGLVAGNPGSGPQSPKHRPLPLFPIVNELQSASLPGCSSGGCSSCSLSTYAQPERI